MKNILFTIVTSYSQEEYFLTVNESESIEIQVYNALAERCFCDDYEIIFVNEVTDEYVEERNNLIAEYEAKYEPVDEAFPNGNLTTLETLKNDIKWRENK